MNNLRRVKIIDDPNRGKCIGKDDITKHTLKKKIGTVTHDRDERDNRLCEK